MSAATVAVSRVHFPVTALGAGRRVGVWFQGCTLACPGCVSRDTWVAAPGHEVPLPELLARLDAHVAAGAEGLTVSGGEPFQQPEALGALLEHADGWRRAGWDGDVLVFSGYGEARLRAAHAPLLAQCDAVVAGRFEQDRPAAGPLRASDNQRLLLLTDRGRRLYEDESGPHPGLQVGVADGAVWLVGLPRRGDLERLARGLRERGVELEGASWRA